MNKEEFTNIVTAALLGTAGGIGHRQLNIHQVASQSENAKEIAARAWSILDGESIDSFTLSIYAMLLGSEGFNKRIEDDLVYRFFGEAKRLAVLKHKLI
ncbi:MAG: hypothetical protein RH949_13310 [Coleofasciculus sp. A1-SPW-01]|uniref:hypothetical protein n=1 Tax=Coleofasciculus sp. A1-SPW-01 TaxID=3070819 RepID=UPI0032F706F5